MMSIDDLSWFIFVCAASFMLFSFGVSFIIYTIAELFGDEIRNILRRNGEE